MCYTRAVCWWLEQDARYFLVQTRVELYVLQQMLSKEEGRTWVQHRLAPQETFSGRG